MKNLASNKKAFHDYTIIEKFEAGVALQGTEVKSCRAGNISLTDAHAVIRDGELYLVGAHIAPYDQGNRYNHEPRRERKLLMHNREIRQLKMAIEAKGMTLVPLHVYLNRSKIKIELGLAKGKAVHDKRQDMKKKMHEQEARRAMANQRGS